MSWPGELQVVGPDARKLLHPSAGIVEKKEECVVAATGHGGLGVRVFQWDDGRVELRCEGRLLPASLFDKNRCVDQGAIVENKRLGAVLSVMQALAAAA